jgi:hypothetical protein
MSSLQKEILIHTHLHFTGMAQGQRAGLITLRSLDRNELPVLSSIRTGASRHLEQYPRTFKTNKTFYRCSSAAERLKTSFAILLTLEVCFVNGYRLISGRSQDRNLSPVFSSFVVFQKRLLHHKCTKPNQTKPNQTFHRLSSGAERQAHNLEVVGSKPTGGIL